MSYSVGVVIHTNNPAALSNPINLHAFNKLTRKSAVSNKHYFSCCFVKPRLHSLLVTLIK